MIPAINTEVNAIPEALSIFINQIVYDKKSRGERVYTYSLGEAFFDIPRYEITDDDFRAGYHYCSSLGQPKLREKIAKLYTERYASPVDPANEVLISAGSKPIIFMLLKAVVNQGEEVIYQEPAWLSYKEQIKLAGGVPVAIDYDLDIDQWERFINEKTKVIILNNPNNPSGRLFTREEMARLVDLAKKHDLFILSDEAYSDFLVVGDEFISFANIDPTKENVMVVNSLSKNMGMSGWRVGYAIAHKDVIKQLLKLNQHLLTCAPTVLQNYMAEHFNDILAATLPQAMEMAIKRAEVQKILDKKGIKSLSGVGTFYFFLDVSSFVGTTDELVYDLLINHNIATVPGGAYGESTKDFIRFGIGVETVEDIEKTLTLIKQYLDMKEFDATGVREQMRAYGIIA